VEWSITMDKKISLKINSRRETIFGIASVALAVTSISLFIWLVYQTAYYLTGREVLLGVVELGALLFALVGFVFGIVGETRADAFKVTAHIGIGLNLMIGIFHIIVLIQGYKVF